MVCSEGKTPEAFCERAPGAKRRALAPAKRFLFYRPGAPERSGGAPGRVKLRPAGCRSVLII